MTTSMRFVQLKILIRFSKDLITPALSVSLFKSIKVKILDNLCKNAPVVFTLLIALNFSSFKDLDSVLAKFGITGTSMKDIPQFQPGT